MKWIIGILFFQVLAFGAYAQTSASQVQVLPLNLEWRYERDTGGEFAERKPVNFSLGYSRETWSALLEYSRFQQETGNASLAVSRQHQEVSTWFRFHYLKSVSLTKNFLMTPYAGLGLGSFQEEVKTYVTGTSRSDTGAAKMFSGVSVGGQFLFVIDPSFSVVTGIEGRAMFSSDFDPNPLGSVILQLGLAFAL